MIRYDLLCIEGIARALRAFLEKEEAPRYKLVYPPGGESNLLNVTVHPEVSPSRHSTSYIVHKCLPRQVGFGPFLLALFFAT